MKPLASLLLAFGLAACGGAATPASKPGAATTPRPTPTAVPGNPGTGGGSGSAPGGGIVIPVPGGGANGNPLLGAATYVKPTQGLVNPRTVNVQLVRAVVNADGTVTADLRWWSGIAPCNALDHVELVRDDATKSIRIKVVEGSGAGDVACIDIAQLSATTVDLGALASGTWAISAEGDAPAIKLEVP
ncbi:MAG: hypothetical protein HYX55_03520 [Chloroflexi bacterium]|nr:hypothetical protein [Chloroflexota bacterium]